MSGQREHQHCCEHQKHISQQGSLVELRLAQCAEAPTPSSRAVTHRERGHQREHSRNPQNRQVYHVPELSAKAYKRNSQFHRRDRTRQMRFPRDTSLAGKLTQRMSETIDIGKLRRACGRQYNREARSNDQRGRHALTPTCSAAT
jgi:hypothetical protein